MPVKLSKEEKRKFIFELIQEYQTLPALWDVKSRDYNNRIKKNEQYSILLQKYRQKYPDADRKELTDRINSLRTNFRKEMKRIKAMNRASIEAGSYDMAEPRLWYYNAMKFLEPNEDSCTYMNSMQMQDNHEIEINIAGLVEACIEERPVKMMKKEEIPVKMMKNDNKPEEIQELISIALKKLARPPSESETLASAWVSDLEKMDPEQQLYARKAINDILLEGRLGNLHQSSIQINKS